MVRREKPYFNSKENYDDVVDLIYTDYGRDSVVGKDDSLDFGQEEMIVRGHIRNHHGCGIRMYGKPLDTLFD